MGRPERAEGYLRVDLESDCQASACLEKDKIIQMDSKARQRSLG
jgi:hypothetical protein